MVICIYRLMENIFLGNIYFYERFRGNGDIPSIGLSFLKKIKYEHVHLTSFSKMRVNLAAQVHKYHSLIFPYMYACLHAGS